MEGDKIYSTKAEISLKWKWNSPTLLKLVAVGDQSLPCAWEFT